MKKNKNRLWIILLICLAIGILIYDTYSHHFSHHANSKKENLTVEYENAGNLLLSNIREGSGTSLHIKVKNETTEAKEYQLKFSEVYNEVSFKESITYSFSRENKTIEISSEIFPSETTTIYDGEVIKPGEIVDYVLTVKVHNIDEIDVGKNIQARIMLEEIELWGKKWAKKCML